MKFNFSALRFVLLCFIFSLFGLILADLNHEKQALLEFSSSVPHSPRLNWSNNTPICTSWIGVSCNPNETHVIGINLPGIGFKGSIPENTLGKLNALRILSLRSNGFTGNLPSDILSIPSLQYVNLQHNNFSGLIPSSVSHKLVAFDVSFNSFSGRIPPIFQNLRRLTLLYLQNNNISGAIPEFNLPSLKYLNLSYNNLNGTIPSSINGFPYTSFVGNYLLCGKPLNHCSTISPSPSPDYQPLSKKSTISKKCFGLVSILALSIGGCAFLSLLVLAIYVFYLKREKSEKNGNILKGKASSCGGKTEISKSSGSGVQNGEKNKMFFFEGCSYNFDLEDLLKASAEVLGKGSYGTTYKAILEDGTIVVVKRLREVLVGKKEFEQQMEIVGRIGMHPNVMPLRAYYYSKEERLLVYNYMPRGSLFGLLHGNRGDEGRTPLTWNTRMKISLGTAKAISSIHTSNSTHGNIKSSNILLSQELNPLITDVGLNPLTTTTSRSNGYQAPELHHETTKIIITQKSDVYSFGVLLLEILTGKIPLMVDLPRWVRSVVREEWTGEVFDEELLLMTMRGECGNFEEEEMVLMLQIAMACVDKRDDQRPEMDEVVRNIEEIRSCHEMKIRVESDSESNVQTH